MDWIKDKLSLIANCITIILFATGYIGFEWFREHICIITALVLIIYIFIFTLWLRKLESKIAETKNPNYIRDKDEIKSLIKNFDTNEKAVLREFHIRDRNTIPMTTKNTVVSGLLEKKCLYEIPYSSDFENWNNCYVNSDFVKYIEDKALGLPMDLSELLDKRPEWVSSHIETLRSQGIKTDKLFYSEKILKQMSDDLKQKYKIGEIK